MGGDYGPKEIVNGCIDSLDKTEDFDILLIGDLKKIKEVIGNRKFDESRLEILHADEVITNEDVPTKAIKTKKNSSMVVGFNLLKEKKGDAFISAGNSGALMTGALLILGRIKGVDRPAFAPILPTKNGGAMLIDAGLNTVCKPINYLQFGVIGSIYMKEMFNIENPKVGLLNVGSEQRKGNELLKQAYEILANSHLNFVGNIEGNDLPEGKVNVAVCDGFVGNVLLKFLEGVGTFIFGALKKMYTKNVFSKLSALIVKKEFNAFRKGLDADEYGGTPILGVDGIVFKCHGNSKAKAVKNAIIKAHDFATTSVLRQIKEEFENMEVENIERSS
jgi:glycerol-3-phosphate acyltransferase PlsX